MNKKQFIFIIIIIISISSCKSSKSAKNKKEVVSNTLSKKPAEVNNETITTPKTEIITPKSSRSLKSKAIINYAKQFKGVRYRWGGTSKSGMDCSGLVYESFRANDILLPRISRNMAKKGKKIKLKDVLKGDLLFFKTGNRRNSINHVGLIIAIRNNDIEFIHSTSSKGVIVSRLNETYWLKAFYEARRIL